MKPGLGRRQSDVSDLKPLHLRVNGGTLVWHLALISCRQTTDQGKPEAAGADTSWQWTVC